MTTPELILTVSAAIGAGGYALDQAMPFGLVWLKPHWRAGIVGLLAAGVLAAAAGLYLWSCRPCQPDAWDCAQFDGGRWGS